MVYSSSEFEILYEYPVNQDQGEWNYEENVRKVEHKFGDMVFSAISLHIPVGDSHLETTDKILFNSVDLIDEQINCIHLCKKMHGNCAKDASKSS